MDQDLKPFHESVVDWINSVSSFPALAMVVELLKVTKIPSNHIAIGTALNNKLRDLGNQPSADFSSPVVGELLGSVGDLVSRLVEESRGQGEKK